MKCWMMKINLHGMTTCDKRISFFLSGIFTKNTQGKKINIVYIFSYSQALLITEMSMYNIWENYVSYHLLIPKSSSSSLLRSPDKRK